MQKELVRQDLVEPELSYKIIGCAFNVHNEIGGGHHEKYYQRALAEEFRRQNLKCKEQEYYPLEYKGKTIGKHFLDFVVESKIVVEVKKGSQYSKKHINQVMEYLKVSNLELALLVSFGNEKVSFERIVNFHS